MWRTPQRLLLTYAAIVAVLGIAQAALEGFAGGWRIVGMNIALLTAGCGAVAQLGGKLKRRRMTSLGSWCGLIICAVGAFNFLRLAMKWQRAELAVSFDAIVAALMASAGLVTAVMLWRLLNADSKRGLSQLVRRIGTVAGALAMVAGFFLTKVATVPQTASAMLESVVSPTELIARLPDSALTDRLVETALDNEKVQRTLIEQGLTAEQIDRLAEDAELRAAAVDALRAMADVRTGSDGAAVAEVFEEVAAAHDLSQVVTAAHDDADELTQQQIAASLSTQELAHLARSLNVSPAQLDVSETRSISFDPQSIEQHLNLPQVQAALEQYQSADPIAPQPIGPVESVAPTAVTHAAAERVRQETAERRLRPEPYLGRTAVSSDGASRRDRRGAGAPLIGAQPNAVFHTGSMQLGMLDAADAQVAMAAGQPLTVAMPSVVPVRRTTTAAPSTAEPDVRAQPALSSTELAAVAATVRNEVISKSTLPAGIVPETDHWYASPAASLSHTGVVMLLIGGALVLCCVALGRSKNRPADVAVSMSA